MLVTNRNERKNNVQALLTWKVEGPYSETLNSTGHLDIWTDRYAGRGSGRIRPPPPVAGRDPIRAPSIRILPAVVDTIKV